MSKVKFKYFQITEKATLDQIENCLKSVDAREVEIKELIKAFNAKDCLQYNRGGIAGFSFEYESLPDMTEWKKVKHGYLPRAKSEGNKKLKALTESRDWRESIKVYGLGGEMIIGEMAPSGRGFLMHSSSISGDRKHNFYAVKVPYQDSFDKELDPSLVEIKEWEYMKKMEELKES